MLRLSETIPRLLDQTAVLLAMAHRYMDKETIPLSGTIAWPVSHMRRNGMTIKVVMLEIVFTVLITLLLVLIAWQEADTTMLQSEPEAGRVIGPKSVMMKEWQHYRLRLWSSMATIMVS